MISIPTIDSATRTHNNTTPKRTELRKSRNRLIIGALFGLKASLGLIASSAADITYSSANLRIYHRNLFVTQTNISESKYRNENSLFEYYFEIHLLRRYSKS